MGFPVAFAASGNSVDAEIFASKIRAHWLIENQLHWVKDSEPIYSNENSLFNYQ